MVMLTYSVIGVIVVLTLWLLFTYNGLVSLRNRVREAWSQIDVQLKKRADLVPNLIETVKGYAKHEKSIMSDVNNARKALVGAGNIVDRVKAGAKLQNALMGLFAIAENYPQLKANENFLQLQQELAAIEDKVAYSRQFYNDSILVFNNSVEVFPGVIFAKMFGKNEKEMIKIAAEERAVPKVSF